MSIHERMADISAHARDLLRLAGMAVLVLASSVQASAACVVATTRTTGAAPFAVHFDALATTMPAATRPFHDVDYSWDFGDASAGVWSTTGRSRNAAQGPVTGHVFATGGTFTVRCTARDGGGNVSTAQVTITVTDVNVAYAGTKTRCVSRSGLFSGAPSGAAQVTSTDLSAQFTWLNAAAGRRLLFNKGETWPVVTAQYAMTQAGGMVGSYGPAAAQPTFNLITPDDYSTFITMAAADTRLIGLKVVGPSATGLSRGLGWTTGAVHNLLMECEITAVNYALGGETDNAYIIANNAHDFGDMGLWMGAIKGIIIGNHFDHAHRQHCTRFPIMTRSVYAENFSRWPQGAQCCLKLHASSGVSEYSVISGNTFQGGSSSVALAPQNSSVNEVVRDMIFERNNLLGEANVANLLEVSATKITIRNNAFDTSAFVTPWDAQALRIALRAPGSPEPAPKQIEIYHNVFINNGNLAAGYDPISCDDLTNGVVRNNIFYAATFTGAVRPNWNLSTRGQGVSSNNLVYVPSSPSLSDDGTGAHLLANPQFISIDPTSANYLKLPATSPALNRGFAGTTSRSDYYGTLRPQGSAPDLGAFEYPSSPTNHAPVAAAQSASTNEDVAKPIILVAADADGDALTYTIVASPAHGTLTGSGASRTYTPTANYSGADSFTFKANDGTVDSNTVTVLLTVTAVNDVPVAMPQTLTTPRNTIKIITLGGTDIEGSALTYAIVTNPAHGTLSGSGASRTYTPTTAYSGADSFTFTVNDGTATSIAVTVSITVSPTIDGTPPTTPPAPTVTGSDPARPVLSGETEAGATVTIRIDDVAVGSVIADGTGHWTWTPGTPLAPGSHAITVIATDTTGNASTPSPASTVSVASSTMPEDSGSDNGGHCGMGSGLAVLAGLLMTLGLTRLRQR